MTIFHCEQAWLGGDTATKDVLIETQGGVITAVTAGVPAPDGALVLRGLTLPGLFGVFFYRSANMRTLQALNAFLPVPIEGLAREFAEGLTPEDVCARTIRALLKAGARHFYISNLPAGRAQTSLASILEKARTLDAARS